MADKVEKPKEVEEVKKSKPVEDEEPEAEAKETVKNGDEKAEENGDEKQTETEEKTEASAETQKELKSQLNKKYGPEQIHVYDIFGIDLDTNAPIFIFLHGGYWQMDTVTRDLYWFIARNLYKHGIKSIFIEYDICPKVTISGISKNIEAAMDECLKYAKECNSRGVYISGHSAGAHLTAALFEKFIPSLPQTTRNLIKGAFLISGIYDLVPITRTTFNIPLKLVESTATNLSPMHKKLIGGETCFYVIIGENDCPAFIEQAKAMEQHLVKLGAKTEYVYLENIDHFDIIANLYLEEFKLTKLIIEKITEL